MSEIKKYNFFKRPTKQISKIEKRTDETKKDYLLFSYKDGEKEAFKVYSSNNPNKPVFLKKEDGRDLPIIDNQEYIDTKIESEDYNFFGHIFINNVSFNRKIFLKKPQPTTPSFYEAIFYGEVSFESVEFYGLKTIFNDAKFYKLVTFDDAKFHKDKTEFFNTEFYGEVSFVGVEFYGEVSFVGVEFYKGAYFSGTVFGEKTGLSVVNFNGAVIFKELIFERATFSGEVDFSNIIINKKEITSNKNSNKNKENSLINFRDSTFKENLKITLQEFKIIEKKEEIQGKTEHFLDLDLTNIYIQNGNFQFNDLLLETVLKSNNSPRETYRILKDILISRHDNINALEMHKKEYEAHYNNIKRDLKNNFKTLSILNFKKIISIFGTFLILFFEKKISYFGTSIGRAIFYWFIIWLIFAILIIVTYDHTLILNLFKDNCLNVNDKKAISYAFQPISFFSDNSFLLEKENIYWWAIEILSFLKTIFLATITYEIIKSFRKFSRKF